MNYWKHFQQVAIGLITFLLGQAVVLIGGIHSSVLRMEVKLDNTIAKTGRISDEVDILGRAIADHDREITILKHMKQGG